MAAGSVRAAMTVIGPERAFFIIRSSGKDIVICTNELKPITERTVPRIYQAHGNWYLILKIRGGKKDGMRITLKIRHLTRRYQA
tara:strand:+ start:259 stop:510 length:252 start_codon:yes stop_codon:yes gene_type:complete